MKNYAVLLDSLIQSHFSIRGKQREGGRKMSEKGEGMSVNIKFRGTQNSVTFRLGRLQACNISA
jgi:hypothetical protein